VPPSGTVFVAPLMDARVPSSMWFSNPARLVPSHGVEKANWSSRTPSTNAASSLHAVWWARLATWTRSSATPPGVGRHRRCAVARSAHH
jgi:hypothetical protein